jgi:hypothetical protein
MLLAGGGSRVVSETTTLVERSLAFFALLATGLVIAVTGVLRIWRSWERPFWDWLELLIIPAVLALGGYLFSRAERKSGREIATNRTREELLQSYFDRMTDLLLKESLRTSEGDAPVKDLSRARTLAVVRQLDGVRKGILLRFLYGAKLIGSYVPHRLDEEFDWDFEPEDIDIGAVISLEDADLSLANLQDIYLELADLRRTNLSRANFKGTKLRMADLMGANLTGAKGLTVAQLSTVRTLYKAQLDPQILEQLKKDHPQLLQKPSWIWEE